MTKYSSVVDTGINVTDPRWVGAWWLGFIVFGLAAILISVPICFFPKSLRKTHNGNDSSTFVGKFTETLTKEQFIKGINIR